MTAGKRRGLTAIVLALAHVPSHDAAAAVRKCSAPITTVAKAETVKIARKNAMEAWIKAARAVGEGYDSWRLAARRIMSCQTKDATATCVAYGSPCIIEQAPKPRQPRPPKGKGIEI